jgi:hypothetical protein
MYGNKDEEMYIGSVTAETHTEGQATQHGCLPSLLGDGDKGIEIVLVLPSFYPHPFICLSIHKPLSDWGKYLLYSILQT